MVEREYVESQLRKIGFLGSRFNRPEIAELENILLEEETIYECVNGYYEGGVALLVATDVRVLLIDKKPMGFLNVDDMRFDMISDLDYSHQIISAQININCGSRSLMFKSYNQSRLRKAISHIQARMREIKREQFEHSNIQKQHLEDINKQLQIYLLAQHQQLERQLALGQQVNLPKPDPQLADYLFAQRLIEEFENKTKTIENVSKASNNRDNPASEQAVQDFSDTKLLKEMEEAGRQEVLGTPPMKKLNGLSQSKPAVPTKDKDEKSEVDITAFKIAYAKLPYLLRSRRYNPGNSGY
jgi:hypothetical protein